MRDRRIFKGLGFILLLFVVLSTLAFSADDIGVGSTSNDTIGATSNDTNETNITSVDVSAPIVDANSQNPGILPPNSKPGGLTYGEWNAKWWQWAYSMPVNDHPLFDTADCSKGQSGNVWFLGSTFATEQEAPNKVIAKANRECTVPSGTMLFFPVLNVEGSTLEGNGQTEAELREYTKGIMDHAIEMSAEIDGIPVKDLQKYRAPSPLFIFGPLPDNNVLQYLDFDAPVGTTSQSVADGIYLMLAPLSVGKHTIHFSGKFKFTTDPDGFDFIFDQDVNYQITVLPPKQLPRMFMPRDSGPTSEKAGGGE